MRNDTVAVRDRKNPERLLGYLTRRPCTLRGPFVEMAVRVPIRAYSYNDPVVMMPDMPRVRFEVSWRSSSDGYDKTAEFLTDAPLDTLASLDTFFFLGESEADALRRQRHRFA